MPHLLRTVYCNINFRYLLLILGFPENYTPVQYRAEDDSSVLKTFEVNYLSADNTYTIHVDSVNPSYLRSQISFFFGSESNSSMPDISGEDLVALGFTKDTLTSTLTSFTPSQPISFESDKTVTIANPKVESNKVTFNFNRFSMF